MAALRKYPDEPRERAIRLTLDARKDPASRAGACTRIGEQLGVNAETLRGWVRQLEVDEGQRPGTTTMDAEKLDKPGREVKELRRANAMAVSSGERNDLGEFLRWCHVAQGLAGVVVEASLDAA